MRSIAKTGKVMQETRKQDLKPSTRAVVAEIQPSDSTLLSTVIDEGSETSMGLLDRSAQHLYNLMHSQLEDQEKKYLEDAEGSADKEMKHDKIDKIVGLSRELRETIRLKSDMLRLKKDIIKDLRRK